MGDGSLETGAGAGGSSKDSSKASIEPSRRRKKEREKRVGTVRGSDSEKFLNSEDPTSEIRLRQEPRDRNKKQKLQESQKDGVL
jgi:hypothetical protein